ncbi:MAG: sn-glycerol-3-phosphate ABC transporter ATP-binding protein UgpC [Hespellia sp.]|nr:sn-glycerol-3-phosphate ABC transporter ATP-binding protein UgpC [Hespellia sp.]
MAEITLKNICKQYENNHFAVKDFNLDIRDKEFIIFVGPSGCGKSTTLRMIAGLEDISDGELWIDDELCNYLEPKDRGMSMVFQNYALYPNMTVYDNMAYALKIRKVPKKEIEEKVHAVARTLEIEHLLKRRPGALSGGQKQRVAIGSAIVRRPKAFLMDEPLSNLDAKLRAQMRIELSKLHRELETTIIYVTHDQTEAMTLGTRIVVMKDGIVQQVAPPQRLYNNPANLFVAGFVGSPSMNFCDCFVEKEGSKCSLRLGSRDSERRIYLEGVKADLLNKYHVDKQVILGIRPEDIHEYEDAVAGGFEKNTVGMVKRVDTREMLGAEVALYFDEQGSTFGARLKPDNETRVGEKIELYFDPEKIYVFDKDTEENIFYEEGM